MTLLEKLLSVAGGIFALLVAPLYFIGWAYLYSYYSFFRIDLYELNPPLQYVLMYAFVPVVYSAAWWGTLTGWATILVLAAFTVRLARSYGPPTWWNTVSGLSWLIGLLGIGVQIYATAIGLTAQRANALWLNDSDPAYVQNKDASDATCSDIGNLSARQAACFSRKHALRYLVSSDKFGYFYSQGTCAPEAADCPTMVFRIPLSEVTVSTRIQHRNWP